MRLLSLIAITTILVLANSSGPIIQNITNHWTFQQVGKTDWHPAQVPGAVHLDLQRNQLIGDPYWRANWLDLQWIEDQDFIYTTQVNIDNPGLFEQRIIELVFEGLDTHARVYLNNKEILKADNMWRTWTINVKDILQPSGNNLTIYFESAVRHDNESAKTLPFMLPCENTRIWSRKAQYNYGWDWGPRLVTCGIWKGVYLRGMNYALLETVFLNQTELSSTQATVNVIAEVRSQLNGSYNLVVIDQESGTTVL